MSKTTWIFVAITWFVLAFAGAWAGNPEAWNYAFSALYWAGAMAIIIRINRKGFTNE